MCLRERKVVLGMEITNTETHNKITKLKDERAKNSKIQVPKLSYLK